MFTVHELTKKYDRKTAVDSLSFTVPDGMVTGFLGPNGSGKSTTMRCMLGLDQPTSGSITVNDVPFTAYGHKASVVGAVLDAGWFDPGRSGRGHLQVLADGAGVPRTRVSEVLDLVGLTAVGGKKVKGYSLGMKQRLGIAASLLGAPSHLIFDEPVNGLDPEGVSWVRHTMRRLAADGCAVLVSSHLLSEMQQTADRLVVIGQGKLIGEYSLAEFLAGSATVYIETDNNPALAAQLRERGIAVRVESEMLSVPVAADGDEAELRAMLSALCLSNNLAILQLYTRTQNLEQRFLDATAAAQEYRTSTGVPA